MLSATVIANGTLAVTVIPRLESVAVEPADNARGIELLFKVIATLGT